MRYEALRSSKSGKLEVTMVALMPFVALLLHFSVGAKDNSTLYALVIGSAIMWWLAWRIAMFWRLQAQIVTVGEGYVETSLLESPNVRVSLSKLTTMNHKGLFGEVYDKPHSGYAITVLSDGRSVVKLPPRFFPHAIEDIVGRLGSAGSLGPQSPEA